GETFNIAGGNERSVLEIAALLLERLKKPASLLQHVTDRPAHDRRYAIDASHLEAKTGFRPQVEFARGIEATIDWYVANRPWWEAIRSGAFRQYYERTYGSR
ncbi:MAG TPA: dTDP-glucose 4,6-dehydratase, partial [Candidatus Omnitrophota bacterium]|nr:dTDP-glucose 4,6-dehydratase [Candidatus Omnitrophota bacterium]